MKRNREASFVIVGAVVLAVTTFLLANKPLVDVDLGWHLAGGLWMWKHGQFPRLDPFASPSAPWIDYSWLFQLGIAKVFDQAGFAGLQFLQTILSAGSAFALWLLLQKHLQHCRPEARQLTALVLTLLSLCFLAPVWHLRPQLLSAIFYCYLLYLPNRKENALQLTLLAAVWANVHVFWILVPALTMARGTLLAILEKDRSVFAKTSLLTSITLITGCISPYGADNLRCLWQYTHGHTVAYSLISEFQPLEPRHGLAFWLFTVVIAAAAIFSGRLIRRVDVFNLLLFAATAVLAFARIKYLPLFGISAAIVFATAFVRCPEEEDASLEHHPLLVAAVITGLAVICLLLLITPRSPALGARQLALLDATKHASASLRQGLAVLNHFDDGGWLALGFLLNAEDDATPLKTSFDGRTLVMGEQRLRNFNQLQFLKGDWCEVVQSMNVDGAVLPTTMPLTEALRRGECIGVWTQKYINSDYAVLLRES